MTSCERVRATLAHKQPDRVVVDLGGSTSTGISAIAYNHLVKHLGLAADPPRIYDTVQQLVLPDEAVLARFGIDLVDVARGFDLAAADWHEVPLADGSRGRFPAYFHPRRQPDGSYQAVSADGQVVGVMPSGGTFFDQTIWPYVDGYPADFKGLGQAMSQVVWGALPRVPWQHAGEADFYADLRRRAIELQKQGRAVVVAVGCNLVEWGMFLRRMDNFLMDVLIAPTDVERLVDALLERYLGFLEKVCNAVGDVADILRFGDDLGMDQGPMIPPDSYRRLFKPRHKIMCDYVKKHSGARIGLHSCGSIYQLLPDLIEAGFEAINPIQTSARLMDPRVLKREFGKDMTFWGAGCDTRRVINRGTPAEVRVHVLENLEILAPGGGFIFATVHNMLPEVPPQNIVAMFDAIREFDGK